MPDCCGGSSRDTALEAYHRKESKTRGCTDVVPLLAFLVNWGVLCYVVHLARTTGDFDRVIFGLDYKGDLCGQDNSEAATGLPAAASFKHVSPAGAAVYAPIADYFLLFRTDRTRPYPVELFGREDPLSDTDARRAALVRGALARWRARHSPTRWPKQPLVFAVATTVSIVPQVRRIRWDTATMGTKPTMQR